MAKSPPSVTYFRVFMFFFIILICFLDIQVILWGFFDKIDPTLAWDFSFAFLLLVSTTILIISLIVVYFFLKLEKMTFKDIGLKYIYKTPILLGLGALIAIVGLIFSLIIELNSGVAVSEGLTLDPFRIALLIYLSFVGIGLTEEVIFRGYIQSRIQSVSNFPTALIL
ncbi:MAG: type II CAAX prenyl endopeptidase Rce1 family protein, partial [Candidatus Hodarchaeota archaeon]